VPVNPLLSDLGKMINNEQFADVQYFVEAQRIFAHSFIMSVRSQKIREELELSANKMEFHIDNIALPIFMEIVRYIYTGTVQFTKKNVKGCLKAAQLYKLEALEKLCLIYLEKETNNGTTPTEYSASDIVAQDFERFVNNPLFSDIAFIVEGTKVYAHKQILNIRSSYFRSILNSGYRESQSPEIVLNATRLPIFIEVLRFIYGVSTFDGERIDIVELIEAANFYDLPELKALCEKLLYESMEVDNACYLLQVAIRFEASQLRAAAFEYIVQHFEDVSNTEMFIKLDHDLLRQITMEFHKMIKRVRQ